MKAKARKGLLILGLSICMPIVGQISLSRINPVKTSGGQVSGKVLASGVKAWLGIPFARPPVNDLRWRPPQPIT